MNRRGIVNHLNVELVAFGDLNGDGVDDFIECGGKINDVRKSGCSCRIMDEFSKNGTLDEINVPNLIYGPEQAALSDYDKIGTAEIWHSYVEEGQFFLRSRFGFSDQFTIGEYWQ